MGGEDRIAIEFFLDLEGGVEAEGHAQTASDLVSLVDPAGARAAHVQLLQGDDVGGEAGDHVADAAHVQLAVGADAAVDVVGEDARHGTRVMRARPLGCKEGNGWRMAKVRPMCCSFRRPR